MSRPGLLSLVLLGSAVMAGCAALGETSGLEIANQRAAADAGRNVMPSVPFDPAEARQAMEPGNGRIDGVLYTSRGKFAWVKKLQNDKTFHPGTEVRLLPATAYVRAYLDLRREHEGSGVQVLLHEGMRPFVKTVRTDSYGRFAFEGVKPGPYVLVSDVFMRNGYTVDEVVGQGQSQFGTTTYTQQRRVDTSYYKMLATDVLVAGPGMATSIELNDH